MIPAFGMISLRSVQKWVNQNKTIWISSPIRDIQDSLCSDPLPSILLMVSFGKGSSLRRVAMDGYDISWIPLHKKKQRKRCLPDNQLDKAALERGHRVITHARQRTLSHHVSLQSRPAMASIQLSRDCIGSSSFLSLTLVLLDLVQLHLFLIIQLSMVILETHTVWIRLISIKDGKMETSRIRQKTKTVQILLWPGRRPSFHFNHFETNSFLDFLLSWLDTNFLDHLQFLLKVVQGSTHEMHS